jgi:hypothetical protein
LKWKSNPPGAPHFGGVWERLIKTIEQALYAALKEKIPEEETLQTLMIEVEFLVNNRPLSNISMNPNDETEPCFVGCKINRSNPRKISC